MACFSRGGKENILARRLMTSIKRASERIFTGKTVLITGASSGIGEAVAHAFAEQGANIVIMARREDRLNSVANDLRRLYQANVHPVVVSVTDEEAVAEKIKSRPPLFASIDILINNAGGAMGRDDAWKTSVEDVDMMIDTNIKGVINLLRHVVPLMIERKSGHIFNIGSIAGLKPYAKGAVYCASKAAVEALTLSLREELVSTPIRTTLISPGMVETEFSIVRFRGNEDAAKKVYSDMTPLTAKDIADQVMWAASVPSHVNVAHIELYPVHQASTTTVHRKA
jgi:3-hydroxy acid dehydrogenase/malonic semialdehyde reductase